MMNFEVFLGALRQDIQPAGRAQHVAGTFQELLAVLPEDVRLADLAAGWQLLARPHSEPEPASVAHRREVCAQLAAIASRLTSKSGNLAGAVKGWQIWQDACQRSVEPRLAAMAKIFARELGELHSALAAEAKPVS